LTVEELGQRMDRLGRLAGAAKMMKGWERAERAVDELTVKLESDIADYREVRRALKCVTALGLALRRPSTSCALTCPPSLRLIADVASSFTLSSSR
jgi:hypothetical protein